MKRSIQARFVAYSFVLPALVLFGTMIAYPLIIGVLYSFTDWTGIIDSFNFVGIKNYLRLFKDNTFYLAIGNTFYITAVTVVFQNLLGLLLAIAMMSKRIKAKGFLKTTFFLPSLLSAVVVCYMWMYILNVHVGLLGWFLRLANVDRVTKYDMLIKRWPALTIIAFILVWQFSGYDMTIYISGLESIPTDLYEAADLDGVSKYQKFFHITLPLIMPSITVNIFINLIGCLKIFEQVYILTKGGPGVSTTTIGVFIYNSALSANQYGYATAISTILFILVLIVTFLQVKVTRSREVEL